jgi:hypothetical protein
MRKALGSLSWSNRYCRSDASVSMDIAQSLGATSRSSKLVGPVSKLDARSPLASSSHTSVRLPLLAARSPSPAVIVVLPTPPLPVTKRSLWSSSSATQLGTPIRWPPQTAAPKPTRRVSAPLSSST